MSEAAEFRGARTIRLAAVAWLAIAVAAVELITFGLQVSGAAEQMLMRADSSGILGVYNLVFGILPTVLGFGLLIGYWWVFRGTRGQLPAFIAVALSLVSVILANLWPYLTGWSQAGTNALMWAASISGFAVLLAVSIAVARSEMLPRHVVLLAYAWVAQFVLVRLAEFVLRAWQSAFIPFVPQIDAGIQGVQHYGGTLIQVAFLLSFAFALISQRPQRENAL